MDISIVKTEAKMSDSDQVRLTEDNSAVMKNFAEATSVINIPIVDKEDLAQVIELNRMIQKIEPSGLLDL